jgi:putative transposase
VTVDSGVDSGVDPGVDSGVDPGVDSGKWEWAIAIGWFHGGMSQFLRKTHNVSVLLYHFVCPTKYRRAVLTVEVDEALVQICTALADRYEIEFLEIGADRNHVHFLIQSVPTYSPTQIIRTIKSITARELFARMPHLKKALWGSAFWSGGFFVHTVGRFESEIGSESGVRRYIAAQGVPDYQPLYEGQMSLFDQDVSDA